MIQNQQFLLRFMRFYKTQCQFSGICSCFPHYYHIFISTKTVLALAILLLYHQGLFSSELLPVCYLLQPECFLVDKGVWLTKYLLQVLWDEENFSYLWELQCIGKYLLLCTYVYMPWLLMCVFHPGLTVLWKPLIYHHTYAVL